MNLYFVLSEQLTEVVWEDQFNYVGHEESYRIAELVLADKPGQAKYLAWKADPSFSYNFRDMPKMQCTVIAKGIVQQITGPRIVSNEPAFQYYWSMT